MPSSDWPPDEISKLAARSGKPLEVVAAMAFLGKGWRAEIGTYFLDGALDVPRELDVLVSKERVTPGLGVPVRVRVLVSCKGFAPDTAPLTYSVSPQTVEVPSRSLLTDSRDGPTVGPLPEFGANGAKVVLKASGLLSARPIVAFDLIRRREEGKGENRSERFERAGDKDLYGGLDSAFKAAFFWANHDRNSLLLPFNAVYVPVLLLAHSFWDVCIDDGSVSDAHLCDRGYQPVRYPRFSEMISTLTLVWSAATLPELVSALDELFEWFYEGIVKREAGRIV